MRPEQAGKELFDPRTFPHGQADGSIEKISYQSSLLLKLPT
jgi:hypothetical protein